MVAGTPTLELKRGCIVLATLNESDSISPVVAEIAEAQATLRLSNIELRILLVDDDSSDGTVEKALSAGEHFGIEVRVLSGPRNGLGAAIQRGLKEAIATGGFDFLITMDADGQHDARQIPDLIRYHFAQRNDVTIGSRWVRGGSSPGTSAMRTLLSTGGNMLTRRIAHTSPIRDATTSFRVIEPSAAAVFDNAGIVVDGYAFFSSFIAVLMAHGFKVGEVPICFRPRYAGVSKLKFGEMAIFFTNLFRIRTKVKSIAKTYARDQTNWAERRPDFNGQRHGVGSSFRGRDELELLHFAENFNQWIFESCEPFLDGDVLEVGAGIGTMTRYFVTAPAVKSILAIEPDPELYDRLRDQQFPGGSVAVQNWTISSVPAGTSFDTILYVNVMEHIRDHASEVAEAMKLLRAGGNLVVFVPASPKLYSAIDARSGHFRRYTRQSLEALLRGSGSGTVRVRYLDGIGYLAYMSAFRIAGGGASRTTVKVYDRIVVPVSRAVDVLFHRNPPIGKNLLGVATQSGPHNTTGG